MNSWNSTRTYYHQDLCGDKSFCLPPPLTSQPFIFLGLLPKFTFPLITRANKSICITLFLAIKYFLRLKRESLPFSLSFEASHWLKKRTIVIWHVLEHPGIKLKPAKKGRNVNIVGMHYWPIGLNTDFLAFFSGIRNRPDERLAHPRNLLLVSHATSHLRSCPFLPRALAKIASCVGRREHSRWRAPKNNVTCHT